MESIHRSFARSRIIRGTDDRILGGVCSGLAARLEVDATAMRLLVLIVMVVVPGSLILLYPLAWILMPDASRAAAVLRQLPAPAVDVTKTAV